MTFDIGEEKRKRHRRTAPEISRHYKCPTEDCPKSYGSEGSLNQHIKLKHPELYAQMCANNQNISKLGSSINGEESKSLRDGRDIGDSYSDNSDNEYDDEDDLERMRREDEE
jgi:hypothetical protein